MFARVLSLATVASLFVFAAAAPANSQCNAGQTYCCNETQDVKHTDQRTSLMMSLVGIDASTLTGVVGTNCSPISALAIAGNSCTSQQVCCQNNKYDGLVVVGCTPINVSL